ncbi:hypothetical protein CPB86DRAFT_745811 [Serendipita vermifera]|nr:hypothetical protein CPB86DRAFT_745811 [Serendipita vermifera]
MQVSKREKPVNLLSIDGRFGGLSALFIIKEMFQRLKYDLQCKEDLRPCDWFDMMMGTDTGGIVVLLLGSLKMRPEQAITAYIKLQQYMHFPSPMTDIERTKNSEAFREIFIDILKSVNMEANSTMQPVIIEAERGKTIVCTTESLRPTVLHLLRSYVSREESTPPCTILQAACSAVASHDHFEPVTIGEGYDGVELRSGLVGLANPTSELLREAAREFGGDTWAATIVSVGGKLTAPLSGDITHTQRLEAILKDTDAIHQDLHHHLHQLNVYFRFDVPHQSHLVVNPRLVYREVQTYKSDGRINELLNEAVKSIHLRQKVETLSDLTSVQQVSIGLKPRPSVVPYFVGRQDTLNALRLAHIHQGSSQLDGPIISVLAGLGGSGKTQISLKFALEYAEKYPEDAVYFVNGSSEVTLQSDLEAIIRSQGAEYRLKTFEDALVWLTSTSNRWLMIVDNVDDPSTNLFSLIPRSRHGHLIVTSRDSTRLGLADPCNRHRISDLDSEAAIELLLRLSSYPSTDNNKLLASQIAVELGYLPLALAHAGAYISIHGDLSSYLGMYRNRRKELLENLPSGLPSDYNFAVAATIEMSVTQLPEATRDILSILSHFQNNSIAESIIATAARRRFDHIPFWSAIEPGPELEQYTNALMKIFCPNDQWSQFDFNQLLRPCLHYSLLQSGENEQTGRYFSMHPLVQTWLRLQRGQKEGPLEQQLFIRPLASSITLADGSQSLYLTQVLHPHIQLINEIDVDYIGDKHAFQVVLHDNGDYSLALAYMKSCLEEEKQTLDEEHPDVLRSMYNLSRGYSNVGRSAEALELGTKAMELRQKTLGDEDRINLRTIGNVSNCYSHLGRFNEALDLEVRVMGLCRKVLGDEHMDTLLSMSNVSVHYANVGRLTEALELALKVMELYQRILGEEDRQTLLSMSTVSTLYADSGRLKEGLELGLKVMERGREIWGERHPDTVLSMIKVSDLYAALGQCTKALEQGGDSNGIVSANFR